VAALHQTIADVWLIGGDHVPMPGEASLAHQGMLLLDARPECRRHVLEVLRQPLETSVTRKQSRASLLPLWLGSLNAARPRCMSTCAVD
jgi:magnesium chelatase family protein